MSIRMEAYILLRRGWKPDFEAVAADFEWRYPQIGKARVRRAKGSEWQATLMIEGAPVEIAHVAAPYPSEQLHPPMRTIGHEPVEVDHLAAGQVAYVVISSECAAGGLEWSLAHAAAVTLVTSVVADRADSLAVIWPDSWVCLSPEAFSEAAGSVLRGQAPLNLWCAFAHSNPPRVGGPEMTGLASLGLRKFIGRELELAPMPAMPGEALGCMREAARRLISGEWTAQDYDGLALTSFATPLTVRLSDEGFLRPGVPAIVLVSPEAAVDAETLTRKGGATVAAEGGGLLKRLFRRG